MGFKYAYRSPTFQTATMTITRYTASDSSVRKCIGLSYAYNWLYTGGSTLPGFFSHPYFVQFAVRLSAFTSHAINFTFNIYRANSGGG